MSVLTEGNFSVTRSLQPKTLHTRTISKSLFLASAFIEGFIKFSYDARAFFFFQTVMELPPRKALQWYHLQCSMFFLCVSLSPVAISLKKPKSVYWAMIIFCLITLIGLICLAVLSFLLENSNAILCAWKLYVLLCVTAFISFAYGGKWFWTRRTIYEQYRFPRELDEYLHHLLNNIFVMNLGRVIGMIVTDVACRTGPSINFFHFFCILAGASFLESLILMYGLSVARKGSSTHTSIMEMFKHDFRVFVQRKGLPEKSVIRTIFSVLPLYVPLVFLLGYRDQKFSRFVRQAEMLNLRVTENYHIHPTFLNIAQPVVIVLLVYPFQFLLDFWSERGITFHTPTRTLCAFIFMVLSLLGGSLVQVFIEDRADESINLEHGCVVVYNTLNCPASVTTKFRKPLIVNPMSHIVMMSSAHIDVLEENNDTMVVTAVCGGKRYTVRTILAVAEMQISEFLIRPVTSSKNGETLTGIKVETLIPRKIKSTFFFANTIRLVYTTSFNMTIGGRLTKMYHIEKDEFSHANPLEIFPGGRYHISINGLLLHELKIAEGISLTILISRSIKKELQKVPLSRIIEIRPPNAIAYYYQVPQLILQGMADLLINTPGFIYASNVVTSEWREALQLMWFFTQAVANLVVTIGIFEFQTPLYNYLVGFCISVWSTFFFVEILRHFYKTDYEKYSTSHSDRKLDEKAKSS